MTNKPRKKDPSLRLMKCLCITPHDAAFDEWIRDLEDLRPIMNY